MKTQIPARTTMSAPTVCGSVLLLVCLLNQLGCSSITRPSETIPANRLPMELQGCSRDEMVQINLAALRQEPQDQYKVGPRDILSVFVPGIVPPQVEEAPILERSRSLNNIYYPPGGSIEGPSVGLPLEVGTGGMLQLPLLSEIDVNGMTLPQVADSIADGYRKAKMLENDRAQVQVSLLKPRVHRVMVIREDNGVTRFKSPVVTEVNHRGGADLVDLPAYENDLMHALATTGGLPGSDAHNRIWIFRNRKEKSVEQEVIHSDVMNAVQLGDLECVGKQYETICIPLRVPAGQPMPFSPEDVILQTGDVVYLEKREKDFFYTGGFLPPGEFNLPRDRDVDVLEAMAIAVGGVGEPSNGPKGSNNYLRVNGGLTNVPIPATQLIVVRKLADGQQFRIRVDLAKATRDANERITVLPGDFLILHMTPGESASNAALSLTQTFLGRIRFPTVKF